MFFSARPDDVLKAVAAHTGLDEADILSPNRSPRLVAARWLVIQLLADECHLSQPAIGRIVHLDPSSVSYQYNRPRPELYEDLLNLRAEL